MKSRSKDNAVTLVLTCGTAFTAGCALAGGSPWFAWAMTSMCALDAAGLAAHLVAERAGITTGTARRYSTEDRLPTPDVIIGNGPRAVRGWSRRTVDDWLARRPGRGARTDKRA